MTAEQRRDARRAMEYRWRAKNKDKVRAYKAAWNAKRSALRREAGERDRADTAYSQAHQKQAVARMLLKAAQLAEAKLNGLGYAGHIKPKGI